MFVVNGKAYVVNPYELSQFVLPSVIYPASLFHCEMLLEANEEVVKLSDVVERFRVFALHARFRPAVILLDGVS